MKPDLSVALTSLLVAASLAACGGPSGADSNSVMASDNRGLPQGGEPSPLDGADFTLDVDSKVGASDDGDEELDTNTGGGSPTTSVQ